MKLAHSLHDTLHALLIFAAAAVAAWLLARFDFEIDFSRAGAQRLTPASIEVLRSLDQPLEVISYARDSGNLRALIATFVERYRAFKPDLSLRFESPDHDPAAMRKLGVHVDGELLLHYHGRDEHVVELSEREFSRALLRLARPRTPQLQFLAGHGERRGDGEANFDLGRFGQALAEQGIKVGSLNLAASASVPDSTDLLIVATPAVALADSERTALRNYLDQGGALIWMADPDVPASTALLPELLGVRALPGTVVDAEGQGLGLGDPRYVAMTHYPAHPVTHGFDLTTLLPQCAALAVIDSTTFAIKPILRSGQRSWTESGTVKDTVAYDANSDEIPGPHDLALALTRLSPRPDRNEQRVLVIGDGDFLSNSFLANGGNQALGMRMVNWVLSEDALADLTPPTAPDRKLELSPRLQGVFGAGFLIVLPLALFLAGVLVYWRRRRG